MAAMSARYDDAVTELYRAPHAAFVTERKRLAGELKAAGDKEGAAKLAKLTRPPVSAWTVNQLWWHDRDAFEAMLATAERLREGDLGAGPAHRDAIAKLRARAAAILAGDGHGASEATLRRVTTTLSAIAAAGGFAPDPPGALTEDRDPPGFETMGLAAEAVPRPAPARPPARVANDNDEDDDEGDEEPSAAELRRQAEEKRRHSAEEAQRRAEVAAEQRRLEQEAARRKAERERVQAALRTAVGEVDRLERDLTKLRASVTAAEERLERARTIAAELEARLAELSPS
jgi:hypothetical protein